MALESITVLISAFVTFDAKQIWVRKAHSDRLFESFRPMGSGQCGPIMGGGGVLGGRRYGGYFHIGIKKGSDCV